MVGEGGVCAYVSLCLSPICFLGDSKPKAFVAFFFAVPQPICVF